MRMVNILLLVYLTILASSYRLLERLQLFKIQQSVVSTVNIQFGSPPKMQSLILDTGSSLTILPCAECQSCLTDRLQPFYNNDQSFTGSKVKCSNRYSICSDKCQYRKQYCEFSQFYLDGSQALGSIISDQVRLNIADDDNDDFFVGQFGCISIQNHAGQFFDRGILGLAPDASQNMIYRWFEQQPRRSLQFSFCIMKDGGGYFQLGHNNDDDSLQVTYKLRLNNSGSHYTLRDLQDLKIGEVSLINKGILSKQGMVIDTGSSITVIPKSQYKKFASQLKNRCEQNNWMCLQAFQRPSNQICLVIKLHNRQNISEQLDQVFPSIYLQFKGQVIEWKPSEYSTLLQIVNQGRIVCPGIHFFNRELYVLGANWMTDKKMTINIKQQTLIIFNNQNCKYAPIQYGQAGQWQAFVKKVRKVDMEYFLFSGIALSLFLLAFRRKIYRKAIKLRSYVAGLIRLVKKDDIMKEESTVNQNPSVSIKKDNEQLCDVTPNLIDINLSQRQQSLQK